MKPELFDFGFMAVHSYGFFVALAYLSVYVLLRKRFQSLGMDETVAATWMFVLFFSGLAGGRLFYVLQHSGYFMKYPEKILWVFSGGLVWYGAFIAGLLATLIYCRVAKLSFWSLSDLILPYIALGQAFGRMGCFMNGCCYGSVTEEWYGLHYPDEGMNRIPVQLFESALVLILGVFLIYLSRKNPPQKYITVLYGIGYGLIRFHLEFLRGDQSHGVFHLTVPQWVSIGLVVISVGVYAKALKKHEA